MKVDTSRSIAFRRCREFHEEQAAKRKAVNADLLPCPFCGSDDLVRETGAEPTDPLYNPGDDFFAIVKCLNCNAQIVGYKEQERYEELENGLYKKIPARTALEVVTEAWNRRK